MKRLLATCVVGLLIAGTANAQVRIFLATEGVAENDARVAETLYENPEGQGARRLYIYGEFLNENDLWLAANFNITPEGPNKTIVGGSTYNHRTGNGRRWTSRGGELNPDGAWEFRSAWIGDPSEFPGGMWNWDEAHATAQTGDPFNAADNSDDKHYVRAWDSQGGGLGTTLLGFIDVDGDNGSLWMTVESPIFARIGPGPDDQVNFGYGDASVGTGEIGVRTDIAEATSVPEPASLVLLGLGALALRRRR